MTQYPDLIFRKKTTGKIDHFEVVEECEIDSSIIIPVGYVTNFASVPRLLWALLPPHGRMANPAVVHDYMYDTRHGQPELGARNARLKADLIFYQNMAQSGVPSLQAFIVFLAVRLFGKNWWID